MVYYDHGREKSMYVPCPPLRLWMLCFGCEDGDGLSFLRNGFWMDWLMPCLVYFINFGPHGPRARRRKDGWEIFGTVSACVAASFTIFWIIRQYRMLPNRLLLKSLVTPPPPRTMTREWQEATNQRFKELGIEPISGPGAEDYKVSLHDYEWS